MVSALFFWSGRRESNPRESAWEADAIPLGDSRNRKLPYYYTTAAEKMQAFQRILRRRILKPNACGARGGHAERQPYVCGARGNHARPTYVCGIRGGQNKRSGLRCRYRAARLAAVAARRARKEQSKTYFASSFCMSFVPASRKIPVFLAASSSYVSAPQPICAVLSYSR